MRTLKIATEDKLHSAESAAELLGVRPSTIRWWWSIGRLPRLKIGRLSRVRESALLALIGREQTASPESVEAARG
ncbi:MAG TPA: helix-turn-helix domain-containing protein [Acidisarcina sp.]|nr:helix-turn-helix domain-containing protein [Acidisarcina sp.]